MMLQRPSDETAKVIFGVLTGSAGFYCLLRGVAATADCLSEEKREGTLGLLFLTDLKGYDVVFGKLVATSLNGLYGVLAVVPIMAVPLLMGGITPGEFGRMALVVVNALFFSLAAGMCVSAVSRSARQARGLTFLSVMLPAGLAPAVGGLVAFFTHSARVEPWFLLVSPGYNFYLAFDLNWRTAQADYWESLAAIHALGWLALVTACFVAPRSWQDKPAGMRRLRWRDRWQFWSYGDIAERRHFRHRLLAVNAFFWLAARARLKPALVWGVYGLLGCAWAWGIAKFQKDWFDQSTYVVTAMVLGLLVKGWIASETGRQLAEDRKNGALELLLSTPLTVRQILAGQRLALQRQFLGPMIVALIAISIFLLALTRDARREDQNWWWCLGLGWMAMLVADSVALYWVGMWQALRARNPNRAASASLLRIIILPWIGYALVMLVLALASMTQPLDLRWPFFLGLWFFLGLAADLGFGLYARFKLLTEFRGVATERYDTRRRWWRRTEELSR
jgi:ABC-type Na+ efflux pump permease subunit